MGPRTSQQRHARTAAYPLGFRLSLHRKDLGIALDAARAVQLDLPVTTLVEQLELDLINGMAMATKTCLLCIAGTIRTNAT